MRIAIIGSRGYPYVYSGYETLVSQLAEHLVRIGHELTVYCRAPLFRERPRTLNGIRLVYLPSLETKIASTLTHGLFATLHVLFAKPDIVLYLNSANGPFGLLTRLFRKRTAINVDGLEWMRPKWRGPGALYFRISSWLCTRLFDAVVTDADEMARVYLREFDAPSVTIAYGADPGRSCDPARIREFGLEPDGYYLVVGRLVPDNNADLVVRGFEGSASRRKLAIVGDAPPGDAFGGSVRRTRDPRIAFTGYVRDPALLRELYCNARAYLHGHEFGGTNPALLQALGYGCCVLALDTPFSREVLDGERHGVYFRKDPASVTEAIDWADREDSRVAVIRKTARDRIAERYTWERITAQYVELFERLSRRRGRSRPPESSGPGS